MIISTPVLAGLLFSLLVWWMGTLLCIPTVDSEDSPSWNAVLWPAVLLRWTDRFTSWALPADGQTP